MKPATKFSQIISKEQDQLWLWVPVIFIFGVIFYINFEQQFLNNVLILLPLFLFCSLLVYFNRFSYRYLSFLAIAIFLFAGFYSNFYQKIFLNSTPITAKVYVDGVAKVEAINKFYNPINHLEGATLLLKNPILYQTKFDNKKSTTSQAKQKTIKKPKKKTPKKSKIDKYYSKIEQRWITLGIAVPNKIKAVKSTKKTNKNFVNLNGYQDLDRKFFDFSKSYQNVEWVDKQGLKQFPNPPEKILISLVKYSNNIKINDVIAVRMALAPVDRREFPDDFNFDLNSKAKKIGGYGYAVGSVKILKEPEISSVDEFFIFLRQKAKEKIFKAVDGDNGAIIAALLIGDQKDISADLMKDIRGSGLAHLLSISGFHLSLMAMIFLFSTRFLLSRSEYLALNFDLKKIAAITAIISTYFYLKISDSPLPAQRSFLMVLFFLVSIFISEKLNAQRTVMAALFFMTLANPYNVFNVGFQLSFAAILVLGAFHDNFAALLKKDPESGFLTKSFHYFLAIIFTSIAIQIATTPFLMHSFRNVSVLGFLANIMAIPLASFFVMPVGFLALFLMPFSLEKYVLWLMKWGVILVAKISHFVANLDYSYFVSPQLSGLGLSIAVIGLFLICLSKSELKFLGIAIFLASFLTLNYSKKPNIAFQSKQRFFVIYDKKDGLIFSKTLGPSKNRDLWMNYFNQKTFKSFDDLNSEEKKQKRIFCDKEKCLIEKENKQFLILMGRNKSSEICQNNFDVIVNLTSKYELPACIKEEKIKIDNLDFYQKGGYFIYFENGDFVVKNTY